MSEQTVLSAKGQSINLGSQPVFMGIVNASPNSFSDAGDFPTLAEQTDRALRLVADGAGIIDVGGESAAGHVPAVTAGDQMDRVIPLIASIREATDATLSIDTYKVEVAEAAIGAGAGIVNDISGLADRRMVELCVETGAALVIMHTRVAPKGTLLDPDFYEDVVSDVVDFFAERVELATSMGLTREQLILDPGPDFAKTPAQTVAVLRGLELLHRFKLPLLWACSRKDFIGAITGQAPRDRLAGTLAAFAFGHSAGAHIFRLHDVASARDFLAVTDVLEGKRKLAPSDGLTPDRYPDPL